MTRIISFVLFNKLTLSMFRPTVQILPNRFRCGISEYFYWGYTLLTVLFPFVGFVALLNIILGDPLAHHEIKSAPIIMAAVSFSILLNKDFYNGKSVPKRILGYQVQNFRTGEAATPIRCIVRNITMVLLPIELTFMLLETPRRLGDYIAGTIVVETETEDPKRILIEIEASKGEYGKTIILTAVCIGFIYGIPFYL
ncbi:hypothetical protein HQ865_14150 [Mucilaginibacter mali]|uniref:RDD domain-containing protein n=1 Tax=Mucilaginibacter mali TaxID=2740462 RepID=A0A7D4UM99_9SPHI|nr:hypothetical protein [Mucilaginibacter mali]QKJ30841.1 hypothetical protein HQ865_14150 [Mucilaginibacter mali]